MDSLFFVYNPVYLEHLTGEGHVEQPGRLLSIVEALEKAGLKTPQNTLQPRKATREEVLLCHSPSYFEKVKSEVEALRPHTVGELSTGDTPISKNSFNSALYAVGGVLTAVDQVFTQRGASVFCIVRPPGHHAFPDHGEGFCLFNNVAIGARYAQKQYGIHRVLIVDWDVHHGNGTEAIFHEDPTVFYFSTHQSPLYPGTGPAHDKGRGKGVGYTLNVPIEASPKARLHILEAFRNELVAKNGFA